MAESPPLGIADLIQVCGKLAVYSVCNAQIIRRCVYYIIHVLAFDPVLKVILGGRRHI